MPTLTTPANNFKKLKISISNNKSIGDSLMILRERSPNLSLKRNAQVAALAAATKFEFPRCSRGVGWFQGGWEGPTSMSIIGLLFGLGNQRYDSPFEMVV